MTRGLRVRPAAEADIVEAHRWYGQQRPGLEAEFVAALDATLSRIAEMPAAHPLVYRNVRRALMPRLIVRFILAGLLLPPSHAAAPRH